MCINVYIHIDTEGLIKLQRKLASRNQPHSKRHNKPYYVQLVPPVLRPTVMLLRSLLTTLGITADRTIFEQLLSWYCMQKR